MVEERRPLLTVDVIIDYQSGFLNIPARHHGKVPGSTTNIQDAVSGFKVQDPEGQTFPLVVDAETQEGIHQVVSAGHSIKVSADFIYLFVGSNLFEPEKGGLGLLDLAVQVSSAFIFFRP